jgi:hypothetical protein
MTEKTYPVNRIAKSITPKIDNLSSQLASKEVTIVIGKIEYANRLRVPLLRRKPSQINAMISDTANMP